MPAIPKVSVLIPTYNYARYLDETIQSVLAQTFTDFELIIVDNRSTDNTDEVVKKYLGDSRVSYHKNETNLGLVGNWSRCLELARGTYIKMLCADDKFFPQLLERHVAVMEQHPDVAVTGSHSEVFGGAGFCRVSPFIRHTGSRIVRKVLIGAYNKLRNPSVVMFRKKHADQVGKFNSQLLKLTDREYYLRLLTLGDCYVIPETLAYVRSHPDTQSAQVRKKKHELILERYWFMKSVKAHTPETDPDFATFDADIRDKAVRSAAVMYEMLPRLHKKQHRKTFAKAYAIARAEGVVAAPLLHYFKWHYILRLFGEVPQHKPA